MGASASGGSLRSSQAPNRRREREREPGGGGVKYRWEGATFSGLIPGLSLPEMPAGWGAGGGPDRGRGGKWEFFFKYRSNFAEDPFGEEPDMKCITAIHTEGVLWVGGGMAIESHTSCHTRTQRGVFSFVHTR